MGKHFLVLMQCILFVYGCSSPSRAPTPSDLATAPTESVEQLIPSMGKLDAKHNQNQASYHFSVGQAASLEGDSNKAIEEYKTALIYDPHSAVIHTRLAGEYIRRGLLTFAIEQCKVALKLDPHYVDARLLLAGLYSSTKLIQEALAQYDEVIKLEPKNSEAYVFKGSLLLEEGRFNEAIPVLQKLLLNDSDYYLGYYYLARAFQQQQKVDLAIKNYHKALNIKPNFSQAGLSLGVLLEEQKKRDEAIKVYEVLYAESGDLQAVARLSQLYIDLEKYDKALQNLLILGEADKDNLNVQVKIGLIYIEQKMYDKAIEVFSGILKKNNEAEKVRYYLASVYEEAKKFPEAIEEFKKISVTSAVYPDATVHIAHLYRIQGDVQKAIHWLDSSIKINSKIPQFYLFRASLLEDLKQLGPSIATLEEARAYFPKDERVLYYLGTLYEKQSRQTEAIKLMHDLLVLNPDNVQALNYIGYTYAVKGEKLNEAEQMLRKAVKLKPGDGYIQDSFGYLLLIKGQFRQATIELEKAFKLRPDEPIIVEHLGDAYLRNNLKQKALQKYEGAARLYTDPLEKEKIEKKIDELKRSFGSHAPRVKVPREPATKELSR